MSQFDDIRNSRNFNPILLNQQQNKNNNNINSNFSGINNKIPRFEKVDKVFLNTIEDGFESIFKKINKSLDAKINKSLANKQDKIIKEKYGISLNTGNLLLRSGSDLISSAVGFENKLLTLLAGSHDVLTFIGKEIFQIRSTVSGKNIASENNTTSILKELVTYNKAKYLKEKVKSVFPKLSNRQYDDPTVIIKNLLKPLIGVGAAVGTGVFGATSPLLGTAGLGVMANAGVLAALPIALAFLVGRVKKIGTIKKIQDSEMNDFYKLIPKGNKFTDLLTGSIKDTRTKQQDIYGFTKQRYKGLADLAGTASSAQSRSIQDRYFSRVEREMKLSKIGMRYTEAKLMSTSSNILLRTGGATTFESKMLLLTASSMDLHRIIAEKLSIMQLGLVGENSQGFGRSKQSLLGFLEDTLEVKRNDRQTVNTIALIKNMFKGTVKGGIAGAGVGTLFGGPLFGSIVGASLGAALPFLWRMVPALL
ncbi:MAG: glycine zipper family protein, partial [Ignavibacteriae bacterium]|nr:glycine zipper family protein [Ignavibacteriota bacterium]